MAYQISNPKVTRPDGADSPRPSVKGGGWFKGLATLVIVIVIIGGGLYFLANYTGLAIGGNDLRLKSDWQAVFLSNGQVYFGKIAKVSNDFVVLRNIYYLQVVTQPLQTSQDAAAVQQQETEQRLTLIKLGNEIHGPVDEMAINRIHVVLVEDLKTDSRVVQAISDYVNQQASQ